MAAATHEWWVRTCLLKPDPLVPGRCQWVVVGNRVVGNAGGSWIVTHHRQLPTVKLSPSSAISPVAQNVVLWKFSIW